MNQKSFIVAIAGGTGSGKTTIARKIVNHFKGNILHIPHDRYYKDHSHLSSEQLLAHNYDHPDDLETALFTSHLEELLQGHSIEIPIYDFTTHTRKKETTTAKPAKLILVEGILIFENKQLRDLFNLKIFVDVAADIRILRRTKRDIEERGRTLDSCIAQYENTARPMHEQFVEPTKQFADIIVPHGGYNDKAVDALIHTIEKRIHKS